MNLCKIYFIAILNLLLGLTALSQPITSTKPSNANTYIQYAAIGLGSNTGKWEPTVTINGTKFKYTYEQNSYYFERNRKIERISSGSFRQSSIDSIFDLIKNLKDSQIFNSNTCILSGRMNLLIIAMGSDTTKFELTNTSDSIANKIFLIINEYLPYNKRIPVDMNYFQRDQECLNYLRDLYKKRSVSDSINKKSNSRK